MVRLKQPDQFTFDLPGSEARAIHFTGGPKQQKVTPVLTTTIDWPGIRANSVSMGIRAAARAAAANLPDIERERFVKRVLKRAEREGWVKAKQLAMSSAVVINEKPLSSNVVNGADSLAATLATQSDSTKLGLSRAAMKAAETLPVMTGEELIAKDTAQSARHWAGVASTVHGWEGKESGDRRVMINIGILTE